MIRRAIVDTGPLVAFLNARDEHHEWARDVLAGVEPPLVTCEAVLSESCFLVRQLGGGRDAVLELLARGLLKTPFRLDAEVAAVRKLMARYHDVPMALADACLVRMVELDQGAVVLTVDGDFRLYRRHRRHVFDVILPD